ncbi:hypothetical protein B4U80_13779 [Leptotrombidium deliense]|uniref:Uncharacterized protein n=1 Tax=Leptotrombidium deliense TaxID=299467 RepID=A0A443SF44_9ACAR|nr:hypothetical protein B4U80_13779 [Leptotrombidium deliense]
MNARFNARALQTVIVEHCKEQKTKEQAFRMEQKFFVWLYVSLNLVFATVLTKELTTELKNVYCINLPSTKVVKYVKREDKSYLLCVQHENAYLTVQAIFDNVRLYPFVMSVERANNCPIEISVSGELIQPPKHSDCFKSKVAFFDYEIRYYRDLFLVKSGMVYQYSWKGDITDNPSLDPNLVKLLEKMRGRRINAAFTTDHTAFFLSENILYMYRFYPNVEEATATDEIFKGVDHAVYLEDRSKMYLFKKEIAYTVPLKYDQYWIWPKGERDVAVKYENAGPVLTNFFDCHQYYRKTQFQDFSGFDKYRKQLHNVSINLFDPVPVDDSLPILPIIIVIILVVLTSFSLIESLFPSLNHFLHTIDHTPPLSFS